MMRRMSSLPPDLIPMEEVWEKLNTHNQQQVIALMVHLAIKRLAEEVADEEKEMLCHTPRSAGTIKSPPVT